MLNALRRESPAGCISDLAFDEWKAGELEEGHVRRIEEHLQSCARCRARRHALEAEATDFLVRAPSFPKISREHNVASKTRTGRTARWRRNWALGSGVVAALAVAAGVALLVGPTGDGGDTRLKGGSRLGFFVKRGERVFAGADGERVRPGDHIRFTASTMERRNVVIVGLDARGVATVYYPPGGLPRASGPGRDVALDASIELDGTLGEERVYGIFCAEPVAAEAIRRELEAAKAVAPRPGCSIDVLRLSKERAP